MLPRHIHITARAPIERRLPPVVGGTRGGHRVRRTPPGPDRFRDPPVLPTARSDLPPGLRGPASPAKLYVVGAGKSAAQSLRTSPTMPVGSLCWFAAAHVDGEWHFAALTLRTRGSVATVPADALFILIGA